ncbi:tyrosine protein kinase [Burkholderia ambifaria]|uniref:GNVR domain-containing protein n=1 Tax=Burkholderia ambifaria TaxID=152480 RepID=UPI001E508161|nr:GNVR domain-containing protein [Burkholderia ambifaria]UEP50888.1 tyrosine protein kinase [Burkholderia ambifaria]
MSDARDGRSAREPFFDGTRFVATLETLFYGRRTIAATLCASLLAGAIYIVATPSVYQAEILVQIVDSSDAGTARSLLGEVYTLFDVKSTAAAETQILASRLVLSRTVDALNLFIDARPQRFPLVGDWIARQTAGLSEPGIFGYGGYTWGQERIDVAGFDVPRAYLDQRFTVTRIGADRYRVAGPALPAPVDGRIGHPERFPVPGGDIILHIASLDARAGARFTLTRHSRTRTIERLRTDVNAWEKVKQSDVIVATLRGTDPALATRVLNEIGTQYVALNTEQRSLEAARSLSFLERQEPFLKAQLTESEARLTALRNQQGSIDLAEEARIALLRAADDASRLIELRQRRETLLSRYAPGHSDVVAIDRQLAVLDRDRMRADEKIRRLPDLQQQVLRRMLDVKVNTDLYTALLNNIQQLQLVRAGKIGNVRLVDVADIPEEPIGPRKKLIVIASALFGVVAGCACTIARTMLRRGVTDARAIEHHVGVRVLVSVPFSTATHVTGHAPACNGLECDDDPVIDSLRALRVMLEHLRPGPAHRIVAVTDAVEPAGARFVATRLARIYAAAAARVLVLDGDMRTGRLSHTCGHGRTAGLAEIAADGRMPAELVIRDVANGIDFLTAGATGGHAADRLTTVPVWQRVAAFARDYDAVLIACGPTLTDPDAAALAGVADTTLLVARAAHTTLNQLEDAVDRLTSSGANIGGIVLNGVHPRKRPDVASARRDRYRNPQS